MAKYLLFDTETTGISEDDRIIQVGGMLVENKVETLVFDELCSTDVPISLTAMEVHHITQSKVDGLPPFSKTSFFKMFSKVNTGDNYLIAHNLPFDLGMIKKEGAECIMKKICTLRCSKHLLELPFHRLQYMRYALGLFEDEEAEAIKHNITIKAHDAIGDVLIMKLLLSVLVKTVSESFPKVNPLEKLVELSMLPVKVKKFTFGKYKGEEIESVFQTDKGYITWALGNMDLDEDLKHTLGQLVSPSA